MSTYYFIRWTSLTTWGVVEHDGPADDFKPTLDEAWDYFVERQRRVLRQAEERLHQEAKRQAVLDSVQLIMASYDARKLASEGEGFRSQDHQRREERTKHLGEI